MITSLIMFFLNKLFDWYEKHRKRDAFANRQKNSTLFE